MKSRAVFLGTVLAISIVLDAIAISAEERMVGVAPPDGKVKLAREFQVAPGTTILGAQFTNNDPQTTFPQVELVRGGVTESGALVVSSVAQVQERTPGVVTVYWPNPVQASATRYYVAICFPKGQVKQGAGIGPAIGAREVPEPNGSYVISSEISPIPIRGELSIALVTAGVGKAAAQTPPPGETPEAKAQGDELEAFLAVAPSPANPAATIAFGLERTAQVTLDIYDVTGKRVRSLIRGTLSAGKYEHMWNGRNDDGNPVATGIYLVALQAGEKSMKQKLVLVK